MNARRNASMASVATITVCVSSPLRDFCGGQGELRLHAANLRGVLDELEVTQPKLHRSIRDETGRVRPHVNVFVNELHMSERDGLDTVLVSGDVITLLPAVSGG
jgi:molybdopterin synthase sulfur carrier subunit